MRRSFGTFRVRTAAMFLLGFGLFAIHPADLRSAPPAPMRDKESYDRAIAALEQRLEAMHAIGHFNWPADTPETIGKLLRGDPQACATFLHRALRYEPYRGVLRGPQGTLDAGGGNSADLALLLREMIRAGNNSAQVRFAVAELSEAQAAKLIDAAASAPPARSALAATSADIPKAAENLRIAGESKDGDLSELWKAMADAQADLSAIRPLLSSSSNDRAAALADARQHVWLQVQKDSKWLTFDPSGNLPLPDNAQVMDELPAHWHHDAKLSVEIERSEDQKLVRETLLEEHWPVDQLQGSTIDLMLLPAELSFEELFDSRQNRSGLAERAHRFERFGPVLAIGDAPPKAGRIFDLKGRTSASPQASGAMGLGSVDPFRRTGRGTPRPPASELTAVFLTITLQSPAAQPQKIERALLDRIGPSARQQSKPSLKSDWRDQQGVRIALVQRHQILIAGGPISLRRVARQAIQSIAANDVLQQALAIKYHQTKGKLSEAVANLALPQFSADLVGVLNDPLHLAGAQLAGQGICYVAAPQVLIRDDVLNLAEKQVVMRSGIDIATTGLRTIGDPAAAQSAKLLHGLWSSELEGRLLLRGETEKTSSAAEILRAAIEQKIALRAIHSPEQLSAINTESDVKETMTTDMKAGHDLLVPEKPVQLADGSRTAWWHITRDGQILAIGSDGRGQAASEGEMVLTHTSIPMVRNCMKFVACFNKAVAGGQNMNDARAGCLAEQITDVVKENLDGSIKTFVSAMQSQMPHDKPEEYNELYGKVTKAYEAYEKGMKAVDGEAIDVPGLKEGQDAANAGKQVGQSLGLRIYVLLTTGRDIAKYASGL